MSSSWTVTDDKDAVAGVTALAYTTTRGQMGALAAAATVGRCGAGSPMVAVMGRGHAAWLVRSLWSDLVRPTLRTFLLDVGTRYYVAGRLAVTISPVLLSVAPGGPRRVPGHPVWASRPQAQLDLNTPVEWGTIREVLHAITGSREVPVAKMPRGSAYKSVVCGPGWAVTASTMYREGTPVTLTVAPLMGEIPWGECTRASRGAEEDEFLGRTAVAVEMPQLVGTGTVHVYTDKSVGGEVIVTQSKANGAVIVVVDVEETHNSRSLAVLSTTTCEFPLGHSFVSLVVMRNWDHHCSSQAVGSRTFIVNTQFKQSYHEAFHVQEHTAVSLSILRHVVDVFHVSDTLFCASFHTNKLQEWFNLYHRDNPTQPIELAPSIRDNSKSHKGNTVRKFMAHSGFIFGVFGNVIDVIEPTTGFLCLTIKLPGLTPTVNLSIPFSGFSS